jgi:hypothetical protein
MPKQNVEKEVIAWLPGVAGAGWPVSGNKPKTGEKYILVDRTGGPREAMVLDSAEILIEVYHKTSQETASDKANEIADAVPGLLAVHNITRAKVNSLVRLDDTLGGYFRYQIYCDVFLRR